MSRWIWGPPNPLWVQNDDILTNYTCRDLCLSIITSKVLGRCERFGETLFNLCRKFVVKSSPLCPSVGGTLFLTPLFTPEIPQSCM